MTDNPLQSKKLSKHQKLVSNNLEKRQQILHNISQRSPYEAKRNTGIFSRIACASHISSGLHLLFA